MYGREIDNIIELFEDIDKSCALCDERGLIIWCNKFALEGGVQLSLNTPMVLVFKDNVPQFDRCEKIIIAQGIAVGEVPYISGNFTFKAKGLTGETGKLYSFWIFTLKSTKSKNSITKLSTRHMTSIALNYNNSLVNILNALEPISMALERVSSLEEMTYLNMISKECYSLFKTTTNFNEYIKYTNGDNLIYPSLISLRTELDDFVERLGRVLAPSKLIVKLSYEEEYDLYLVNADVYKLMIAILNVLNNSFRHTLISCPIQINVSRSEDIITIKIIDDGDGMEQHAAEHAFEPFYSTNSVTKMPEGLGLGLYVAKVIIEAHDGSTEIESTEYLGTTVTIKLPVAQVSPNGLYLESSTPRYDIFGKGSPLINSFLPSTCFCEY